MNEKLKKNKIKIRKAEDIDDAVRTINFFKLRLIKLGKDEEEKKIIEHMIDKDLAYKNRIKGKSEVINVFSKRKGRKMNNRSRNGSKGLDKIMSERVNALLGTMDKHFQIIKKLDDRLPFEQDVKNIAKIKDDIRESKDLLKDNWLELEKLISNSEIYQMDNTNELNNYRGYYLSDIDVQLNKCNVNQLNELLEEIKIVFESFKNQKNDIPGLSEAEQTLEENLELKHKLKVTIPIIPILLKYEGEVSVTTKISLRSLWEKILILLRTKI